MIHLIKRELSLFFGGITGYLIITVFLVITGLFLWVFQGSLNVLDSGFASLEGLFVLAPWIFLFLVPAITMRSFAEERRSGTLELLLSRPMTELQIILSKYLAALILVLLSLIPTWVYVYSLYRLGSPPGNLDTGAIWGSYIGLFFLAAIYSAIGIFVSTTSENQVVAFILAVLLCFIMYIGFDYLGALAGRYESFIIALGINEHYLSMSRGVIDSRDVIYFLSVMALFLYLARTVIHNIKW